MLTTNQINARIKTIGNNSAKLREQIQTVLINIAAHAYEHGRVTEYQALFNATSGVNRKKMTAWIHDHGFARIQKDGSFKVNKAARKDAAFDNGDAVVKYLTENAPYWYADEETAAQVKADLDVAARVQSLASQIAKANAEGRHVKVNVRDLNNALEALKGAVTNTADSLDQGKADKVLEGEPAH